MTGRERIARLLRGETVDRVPVMASFIAAGAEWRGIPQSRLHCEADTLANTLVGLTRDFGLDGAYVSSDNWIIHGALGGDIHFPENDEPVGPRPVLADWDRLEGLNVPDPRVAERMRFMLDVARDAVRINDGACYLEANIDSGPFQMAGILRGTQALMQDVVLEPAKVHELLAFCTRVAAVYGAAMAETGVDGIQFGDSTASLISADMYAEFVEPYQRQLVEALHAAGVAPFLHVCGNSNHLATRLAQSGAACVEIDAPADLAQAFDAFGNRAVLRGNVATMVVRDGTAGEVTAAAQECLRVADGRRFILSPGCGVPRGTPEANIHALVDAACEYGQRPGATA